MKREDLDALHYITPIANVLSILTHGIMSHRRATKLPHQSIAMTEIQDRRQKVVIPNARPLHEYVNLYLCARNPMTYRRKAEHRSICVLRISPDVLDLPGVVIADQNASSDYVRFSPSPAGLAHTDREMVFAERWTHPGDPIEQFRHRSIKCAEVLVPDRVDASYIIGAYVSGPEGQEALSTVVPRTCGDCVRSYVLSLMGRAPWFAF